MEKDENVKPARLGMRIGIVFFIALATLIFAAYVVISRNFQNLLKDYTLQLVQSMVEQGVTTVEYELSISQSEARELARFFADDEGGEVTFPTSAPDSDLLRLVYITGEETAVSDGRQRDVRGRADIINAFEGKNGVYGPYFNEDNEYVICYSVPVIKNGEIAGVLSLEKDGYFFCTLIENIRFEGTGESYIINAEGTDIAVSEPSHIEWVNEQYNARRILEKQEDSVTRSIMELEQRGLDGETGVGTYYWDDGLCYLFYTPIPSVNWVMLAGVREEELVMLTHSALYASITKSPVFSACVTVFLLLTGLIVYWIVSSFRKTAEINKSLNVIANFDPLTGTLNRNSFHKAMDALSSGEYRSIACIYIDANGLHEINNHLGHQAGDNMLKAVVKVLHDVFSAESVYRIGGDEFVVFCQDQTEREVYHKTELAREEIKKQGYEISIGVEWRDSGINIKGMVNIAEESMKLDKQRYYRENGKERQIRALDEKLEQMVMEKQDADAFLSILAPEFKGVYFVDLGNDTIRHLYIPSYFEEMLDEAGDVFSKALELYAERVVMPEYRQEFKAFCNFGYIEKQLNTDATPEYIYQKTDNSWLKLRVLKFKTYTGQCKETLWIFSGVDSQV